MNKFLLLTLSIVALGFAAPAMADDHGIGHEAATEVEATMDETVVVEPCFDIDGVEIECPVVEDMTSEDDLTEEESPSYE